MKGYINKLSTYTRIYSGLYNDKGQKILKIKAVWEDRDPIWFGHYNLQTRKFYGFVYAKN